MKDGKASNNGCVIKSAIPVHDWSLIPLKNGLKHIAACYLTMAAGSQCDHTSAVSPGFRPGGSEY